MAGIFPYSLKTAVELMVVLIDCLESQLIGSRIDREMKSFLLTDVLASDLQGVAPGGLWDYKSPSIHASPFSRDSELLS